jgi:hypothetical protein
VVAAFEARRAPGDALLLRRAQPVLGLLLHRAARPGRWKISRHWRRSSRSPPRPARASATWPCERWDDRQPDAALRARLRSLGNFQGYELTVVQP